MYPRKLNKRGIPPQPAYEHKNTVLLNNNY